MFITKLIIQFINVQSEKYKGRIINVMGFNLASAVHAGHDAAEMKAITYVIFIKNESAVQGWERVRTHYQSKVPNPTPQPLEGRKRENRQQERAD